MECATTKPPEVVGSRRFHYGGCMEGDMMMVRFIGGPLDGLREVYAVEAKPKPFVRIMHLGIAYAYALTRNEDGESIYRYDHGATVLLRANIAAVGITKDGRVGPKPKGRSGS
jgi:hypothetical protein